ncbi:MAG: IS5 family transposase, partial [Pseudomonadota bacterium]
LRRQLHRQGTPGGKWRKRGELEQGIGRSRGGRGSKVHVAVDDCGRPLRIDVTGAQTHDSKAFDAFLYWDKTPLAVVADKAYGSAAIRQAIHDEGAVAVIPSKSNAKVPIPHDPNLYAMRNLVERFFCRMKDMRRLTTRYEKMKRNFLSMLHIFAIRCWLN